MQPRRQRLPAPWSGPRGPRPTAPLLALLLLLAPVVAPAGSGGPDDPGQPQDAGVPRRLLQQAARAALHFFNFRSGSPSQPMTDTAEGEKWEINPKEGCKVHVVFSTERYNPESLLQEGEGRLGKCSARVFFKNQKPRPTINVTCTRLIEKKKRQQEDYLLYKQMKQLKNPLETVSIPGMNQHLEFLHSGMYKTNDDTIDFDYTVLLHELSTQEIIPCRIHLVWYPGKPLKVKYHCQELQTPEEASGTEEGSAVVPTELSNF
uniref:Retinoic acid receptor responder 1 n=1 Tax=Gorilla gorilla gorilla TaxID=9595 RepID=G3R7K1_GORGO